MYAVQALNRSEATKFYRELATRSDGFHLMLDQFFSIVNFMLAICFREEGGATLDTFKTEVVAGGKKMSRELHRLFATLQVDRHYISDFLYFIQLEVEQRSGLMDWCLSTL